MTQVALQKCNLLEECRTNAGRRTLERIEKAPGVDNPHPFVERRLIARFCNSRFIEATACAAVSNGPYARPAFKSARLCAISRSTTDLGVKVILRRSILASNRSPIALAWGHDLTATHLLIAQQLRGAIAEPQQR
jgi:hypothetical protein